MFLCYIYFCFFIGRTSDPKTNFHQTSQQNNLTLTQASSKTRLELPTCEIPRKDNRSAHGACAIQSPFQTVIDPQTNASVAHDVAAL